MARAFLSPILAAGLLAAVGLSSGLAQAQERGGLATYKNERHGFSISYPQSQFIALPVATEDARAFVTPDDKARLLVGTLPNSDGKTLAQYRAFLLAESYPGAKLDYAPVRDTWFVLSGTRSNGTMFYQRVNFTCGGRAINSWILVFPAAEQAIYELVIEQVHRTYRLGAGKCAPATVAAK